MTTIHDVEDFLALHRIAMVGVSRNPKDFSRLLFREMCDRGYDMVPINLGADEIHERECFHSLQAVKEPVEGVLVMTPFHATLQVVQDCAAAGVRNVWIYRAGGRGAVSPEAIAFCMGNGICRRLRDGTRRPLSEQVSGLRSQVSGLRLSPTLRQKFRLLPRNSKR